MDSSVGALRQTLFMWLQLADTSGTTPAEIAVAFSGAALPAGRYRATIAAASSGLQGVQPQLRRRVTIDELVAAVSNVLDRCPSP